MSDGISVQIARLTISFFERIRLSATESAPSREHQRLVGFLIKWITDEGFNVQCATYGNYPQCEAIGGVIADVSGFRADVEVWCNGEAETEKTIATQPTKDQIASLARRIVTGGKSNGAKCPFYIAIPSGSEQLLISVLRELNLLDQPHVKWRSFPL
jgi:hypothetical protein